MREIKFRAWDKVRECWIWKPRWQVCYNDVNTELVQYTGLKDKNGKEIYEGDILKFKESKYRSASKGYYLIEWKCSDRDEGADCGFVCERNKPKWNYMNPNIWKRMEVIGNIYENPELLKEKK